MRAAALLVLTLALLAGCGGGDGGEQGAAETPAPAGGGSGEVRDLANVLALRADFEADAGKQRVLLLLSPT